MTSRAVAAPDEASGAPVWWREASGSVADLGVLVPIAVVLVVGNGLAATAVLLPAGLAYLVVAWTYRAPVPVQPLKAFGAAAIAAGAGADVIAAGSILLGLTFLVLGAAGVLDRVAAVFPRAVIRGVQLAVGLVFGTIALGLVVAPPTAFTPHWPAAATAVVGLLATALLLRWRRWTALAAVAVGLVVAVASSRGVAPASLGPTAIPLPDIDPADLAVAATLLVLPQVPLTLTNSCLAPADAAGRYFPAQAARITPSRLALTLGGTDVVVGAIAGMPLCHGAGGMSAHYAFGARTWRAPALVGGAITVLALLLGRHLAVVLQSFPLAVLAALLLVAGVTHVQLLRDLRGRLEWVVALGIGAAGAAGHLLLGVLAGLLVFGLRAQLARRRQ